MNTNTSSFLGPLCQHLGKTLSPPNHKKTCDILEFIDDITAKIVYLLKFGDRMKRTVLSYPLENDRQLVRFFSSISYSINLSDVSCLCGICNKVLLIFPVYSRYIGSL